MVTPEDLHQKYVLLEALPHGKILPFIQKYLKRRTHSTIIYYITNSAVLLGISYLLFTTKLLTDKALSSFSLGIFLSIALIPIHELIHGLAYKFQGAESVTYKGTIRAFVFYAVADK